MKINALTTYAFLFLVLIATATVRAQDAGRRMTSKEVKILIDSLSKALRTHYIYSDKAEIMVSSITKKYKSGVYNNAKNRTELARQLNQDLQDAHPDRHMGLNYHPEFAKQLETPVGANVCAGKSG